LTTRPEAKSPQPETQQQQNSRATPAAAHSETIYDDDQLEIPAFLRRQAN
jgi:cell division protein FtsZ